MSIREDKRAITHTSSLCLVVQSCDRRVVIVIIGASGRRNVTEKNLDSHPESSQTKLGCSFTQEIELLTENETPASFLGADMNFGRCRRLSGNAFVFSASALAPNNDSDFSLTLLLGTQQLDRDGVQRSNPCVS